MTSASTIPILAALTQVVKEMPQERTVLGVGAEGWTALFTGGLLFFTMALAIFTYRLFRVTKDGLSEQAEFTRASLRNAEISAQAAEAAVRQANEASKLQLKAYLSVREVSAIPTVDNFIRDSVKAWNFNVKWSNAGQTPAYSGGIAIAKLIKDYSQDTVVFPRDPDITGRYHSIGPNIIVGSAYVDFSVAELKEIMNQKKRGLIVNIVTYDDAFGSGYRQEVCVEIEVVDDPYVARYAPNGSVIIPFHYKYIQDFVIEEK